MPTDPLSTLALATGGAFLGKFVGPAAESLGKAAWERAQQLGQQAHQLLATVGREPQPVEPKLLVPLVQAAALETDETLVAKWAALLANAADPAQGITVQPAFPEILRQLTPADACLLGVLYFHPVQTNGHPRDGSKMLKQFASELNLPFEQVCLSVDNLLRLRLCIAADRKPGALSGNFAVPSSVVTTTLGLAFMRACSPPERAD